jgi:dimethylamine/trimethylamine dehydrogenase
VPIRCTQNPTMGEEWRRGWDPESIKPKKTDQKVLVVGSGPSGLECTLQLARRGYHVTLAEADNKLGGRVIFEAGLKGLSAWKRVADNRLYEIQQKNNIEIYKESELTFSHINELGINNIFLATGSSWRKDGVGRSRRKPIQGMESLNVLTPEEAIKDSKNLKGPVVVYDDEQGYLGGVVADHLSSDHHEVIFITPAGIVSPWTESTLEQKRVQKSLLLNGVNIICNKSIDKAEGQSLNLQCVFTREITHVKCSAIVMVTERIPNTTLYDQLIEQNNSIEGGKRKHIQLIGDAESPGLIADAVFLGHLAAQNFEEPEQEIQKAMFMREMPSLK